MSSADNIEDVISAAMRKKTLPWVFFAFIFAVVGSGFVGLYFGYQYASSKLEAKAANDKASLVTAYNLAIEEKEARRKDAESRGRTIESNFVQALRSMQVINKTYYNEVQKETEKLVYTDCKLPDSGVDLLNRHIDDVNMQFIGKAE